MRAKCPGQDTRFWKPEDVFEVGCPGCGERVEFFRDDVRRRCRRCGRLIQNPKLALGCAVWCASAKECLGCEPGASGNPAPEAANDSEAAAGSRPHGRH